MQGITSRDKGRESASDRTQWSYITFF